MFILSMEDPNSNLQVVPWFNDSILSSLVSAAEEQHL